MNAITTTHSGVIITFSEHDERWIWERNGRERSHALLSAAREAIDKRRPAEKKTFTKIKAFKIGFMDAPELIEVTSIAADVDYRGRPAMWCNVDGRRSKETLDLLREYSEANIKIVAELAAIKAQTVSLNEIYRKKQFEMTPLTITE